MRIVATAKPTMTTKGEPSKFMINGTVALQPPIAVAIRTSIIPIVALL